MNVTRRRLNKARSEIGQLKSERQLREDFVSMLSHDLRNPLSAAIGRAEMIVHQSLETDTSCNFAKKIIANLERVNEMIGNLLDANGLQTGRKLPLTISECDLTVIASRALEEMTILSGNRFHLESGQTTLGYWSGPDLRRAIDNLLGNAVKYGCIGCLITLSVQTRGKETRIMIHNDGNPISKEDQHTLFQQFPKMRFTKTGERRGWGLGLILVKGVAEAHGGKVKVESTPARGTTFSMVLPTDCRQSMAAA